MLRAVLGVVLSYLLMAALIFGLFTLAYLALGADGAFQPDSYEVSQGWIVLTIGVLFVTGIIGGYVCVLISNSTKTAGVLAALMLVLGVLSALYVMYGAEAPTSAAREGTVDNLSAMMKARQPLWLEWVKPVLGPLGCILGSRLKKTA